MVRRECRAPLLRRARSANHLPQQTELRHFVMKRIERAQNPVQRRHASERKRPGQCHAPGCALPGERWVGALFLCGARAQRWPRTWGELQALPEDAQPRA